MSLPYWEYFLSIESDLERCTRFVEFAPRNYETHSIEFARIIMAAASEFDTLAKDLCGLIDSSRKPQTILEYNPIIVSKYPRFTEYEILLPRFKLSFTPWEDWNSNGAPDWWSNGYNKIKHERDKHFYAANLRNALLATAGLLTGILYFYDSRFQQKPEIDWSQSPRLLSPKNYASWEPGGVSWSYTLLL